MRKFWVLVFLLLSFVVACDRFGGGDETPNAEEVTETPTLMDETTSGGNNPSETTPNNNNEDSNDLTESTTENAGTPTPDSPYLIAVQDMNVRRGPGRQYEQIGGLFTGESAAIIGRAPNALWWQIECPPVSRGSVCWVSGGSQYTEDFNTDEVPIIEVSPTSIPSSNP